ncbi:hypothetical protein BT96DRAFT_1006721 [Gymnopus androsaceus JB14]|uniref:Uncharacterized protein n=1 Tax=Gymnopus androsaceus JB14 TaxID=1447944 RepID=A0A6A4GJE0_9AGAR|nr:hypothetical protein BT96DRAFT_1006721 [Gymnopus androsaceus JB14]
MPTLTPLLILSRICYARGIEIQVRWVVHRADECMLQYPLSLSVLATLPKSDPSISEYLKTGKFKELDNLYTVVCIEPECQQIFVYSNIPAHAILSGVCVVFNHFANCEFPVANKEQTYAIDVNGNLQPIPTSPPQAILEHLQQPLRNNPDPSAGEARFYESLIDDNPQS